MAKKVVKSVLLEAAQKELLDKMKKASEEKKKKVTVPKKMREVVKELREEFKEKTDPAPKNYTERYEEELKQSLFNNTDLVLSEEAGELKMSLEGHTSKDGLWDVPIDEEIQYFDPTLSYELTGYRPINEEQGLDFDPTPFTEAAATFNTTGSYTEYPAGSKAYSDFWKEQYRRCQEGYTVGKYTITGDHYFFLNFYRMETVVASSAAGAGRNQRFPSFLAKQYEFFHYVKLAELCHKDVAILKARGLGLSEIVAGLAVRPYTTNKGYRTLLTAASATHLEPLKNKCWLQLNWLDLNTGGGMKHVRLKVNNADVKRASQVTPDGVEFGWMSEIASVVADDPKKVRGDRVDRLIFEEAGSNKNLLKSWIQGNALVDLGGVHFGSRIVLGTGGDDMALEGLSTIFQNPEAFNVLPYKHRDTEDGKPQLTAFFLPAHKFSLKEEYLDARGVTDSERFKEFYKSKRRELSGKALLDYCAEHCFIPNEALYKQGENMFDSIMIADRLTQIRIFKEGAKPRPVTLLWKKTADGSIDYSSIGKVEDNPRSKLIVFEEPLKDEAGNVYKNLYVAGIDSIDQGTEDSSTTRDVSDFCIVIKRRAFGLKDPKYVAIYKDRPRDIRDAYDTALRLLVWYNCKALLEHTKISIITYFKEKKKDYLFMKRPKATLGDIHRGNSQMLGVPATEYIIKHGLELINNFVNDYCYGIDSDEMLEQLLKYSWENKRKFDIIASMSMAEIADEDMMGFIPKTQSNSGSEWQDIGYYTDEYGHKKFGVIPKPYGYNRYN